MRLRLLRVLIGFALASICSQLVYAGKVECLSRGVRFIGKIEAGDYQKVVSCQRTVSSDNKASYGASSMFVISSPGGSVSEAMKIGRYVRNNKMWVTVIPDTGKCFSSCVYILAAGSVKYPWGEIGIHRPYFETKPNQGYDSALKTVLDESRVYFRQMNIPETLADDMFSIPPQDMQLLGDAALSRYRLNQTDMAYEEENANRNAAAYGLTRGEYMRRLKQSEQFDAECRSSQPKPTSNSNIVRCLDLAYKKSGLILKP